MKKITSILLAILIAITLLPLSPATAQSDAVMNRLVEYGANLPAGYGVTSVDDFVLLQIESNLTVLDVREPDEFNAGHIPNAIHIPMRTLGENLNLLPDLNAKIIVVCKGGFRATLGMTALQVLGYTDVIVLKGGFDAYVGEELEVVTDPFVAEPGTAPEVDPEVLAAVSDMLKNLPANWGGVSPSDLNIELAENPPLLIDVRSQGEWDEVGYIEGAQHIWINEFMAMQDMWPQDKDANIVVYCASSFRGGIAMVMLRLMGYTNVRNLSGGMNAWISAGLPVEGAAFNLNAHITNYYTNLPNTFNAMRVSDLEAEINAGTELLLVDVRDNGDYAEGHLEGAINIPITEITQHLDMLPDLNQNMVIYCGSGHRSAIVMQALTMLGYTNVRSLMGGTKAIADSNLTLTDIPTEYTAGTAPTIDSSVLAAVDSYMTSIPAGYYTISAADLNIALSESEVVLIDVRTQGEWDGGRIEGAIHIPLSDFMTMQDMWPAQDATIVVYDNPSHRGAMAMMVLQMLGYENVRALSGGTGAWVNAGFTLVTE